MFAAPPFEPAREYAYKAIRLGDRARVAGLDGTARKLDKLIDPRHFRDVLGSYPTGVSVITSVTADGTRWGLAVGTFTAISLDPPLVGFMPDRRSHSWLQIEKTGAFCVNILSDAQMEMCRRFAARGGDKFDGISHSHSPSGLPLLDGVLAWVECGIEQVVELGDHVLVVGAVRALERSGEGLPLLFHRGGYHTLDSLETPAG